MAELAIPIQTGVQECSFQESAQMQKAPASNAAANPSTPAQEVQVLAPVELLHLFCQNPPSIDCLPSKKGIQLADETAKLHRALKFFIKTNRAEPLLLELNKEKLDIAILYFAARLWGNPEAGIAICKELEKSPPKANSAGEFLFSLLKPLSMEKSFYFWSSLGETPPMQAIKAMRKAHMKKAQKAAKPRKPLLKAI